MNQLKPHIRIISPASPEDDRFHSIDSLQQHFTTSYQKLDLDTTWPFVSAPIPQRLEQLLEAVLDPSVTAILAARGGYGASDLLDHIPWSMLGRLPAKPIVGFSDISALHSAFFTILGWHGIHGPMPATEYWQGHDDVKALLAILQNQPLPIELPLLYLGRGLAPRVKGWGFGGCLSVLSNLIGTPYIPKDLSGALLFWEDIGEHPARILRFINQWQQSGLLKDIAGVVLGRFVGCSYGDLFSEADLHQEISRRIKAPIWYSPHFGHCTPNWPLPIGFSLIAENQTLSWNLALPTV